jgi:hypothetical protein
MEFYCWYSVIFGVSFIHRSSSKHRSDNRHFLLPQPVHIFCFCVNGPLAPGQVTLLRRNGHIVRNVMLGERRQQSVCWFTETSWILSNHVTSRHNTSRQVTSHYVTLRHTTSHHITSQHSTSYHVTSRHITSHHTWDDQFSTRMCTRTWNLHLCATECIKNYP